MDPKKLEEMLAQTFEDARLSRSEKRALKEVLGEAELSADELRFVRGRAFDRVQRALASPDDRAALLWLEQVVKVTESMWAAQMPEVGVPSEAHFSPGLECRQRIIECFQKARRTADVCVFTITDNEISTEIERAKARGVAIRIITDNDKATDPGSDVDRLASRGVPVRVDRSEAHMHHKFAIFDGKILLTGSYNWTRSAYAENQENLVVVSDQRLLEKFRAEFERLWAKFK